MKRIVSCSKTTDVVLEFGSNRSTAITVQHSNDAVGHETDSERRKGKSLKGVYLEDAIFRRFKHLFSGSCAAIASIASFGIWSMVGTGGASGSLRGLPLLRGTRGAGGGPGCTGGFSLNRMRDDPTSEL